MRLVSYNIRYGGVGRVRYLAAVIADCQPDVVVFQEAIQPRIVEQLARETAMPHWNARHGQSLAFMSRLEVGAHEWHQPPGVRRAFLELTLARQNASIFGVHLSAVHSNWTERWRRRELRALLDEIGRRQRGLHVLTGDFNTLAPGASLDVGRLPPRLRAFIWLSGGRVRWQTIQMLLDARYIDAFPLLHPDDAGFTFPTTDPHVRLDYLFVPAPFADRVSSCAVGRGAQAAEASDHFPLICDLELG